MGKRTSSTSSSTGAAPSGSSSSSSAAGRATNAMHYTAIKAEIETSYKELFENPKAEDVAAKYNNNRCWACPRLHIDRDWHEKLFSTKSNANLVLRERGITVLTQLHAQAATKSAPRACTFRIPSDTSKTYYTVASEPLVRLQWLNRERLQICFDCERARLRTVFTAPQVFFQRVHQCSEDSQLTAVDLTDDGRIIVTADDKGSLVLSELSTPPATDSAGSSLTAVGAVKRLRLLSTKSIQKEVGSHVWRHISAVRFVRGPNNHKYFLSGDHYGHLVVWDCERHHWEQVKYDESMPDKTNFATTGISDLRFLSDDKIVTAHSMSKSVGGAVVWSVERKRSIESIPDTASRTKRVLHGAHAVGTAHVVPLHLPNPASSTNEDAHVLLMASAVFQEIDVVDLRVLSQSKSAVQQFQPAVPVSSICALPRRPFQFATATTQGHISYYDLRVPSKALFTISEQIRGWIYQIIPFRRDILAAPHDGVPFSIDFDDESVRFAASGDADKTGGGSGVTYYELTGGAATAFETARTLKAVDNDSSVFVGYSDKSVAKFHVPLTPSSSSSASKAS